MVGRARELDVPRYQSFDADGLGIFPGLVLVDMGSKRTARQLRAGRILVLKAASGKLGHAGSQHRCAGVSSYYWSGEPNLAPVL